MDVDANGMGILSRAEAVAFLQTQEVGRLVYTRRALPAITPVNYAVYGGVILIWTGSQSALGQAVRGAVVAFEVDDLDRSTRSGWSVVVTGQAELVTDEAALTCARIHGPVPWAPGVKNYLIRIPPTLIIGRRVGPGTTAATANTWSTAQ